ncbi:MAG TPA: winged helix-turn-helix domain-containing protein [Pyrinomonadaceae bacterium]|nr:winged helix-turn-helix domain-containing protein [Pyrinomonadaceae bacterium]
MSFAHQIFKFNGYVLDMRAGTLTNEGTPVHITPKAFRLLCVLVENRQTVLTKKTLLDEVWGETFVEEGNLTFNIRQLRILLGDSAKEPKYIETIPKVGYRFVAAVETEEHLETSGGHPTHTKGQTRGGLARFRWAVSVFVVTFFLAAITLEGWLGVLSSEPPDVQLLTTPYFAEPISTEGNVAHAVISHDGRFVVYVAGYGNERQSLRLLELESRNSREVIAPLSERYMGLALSPDDEAIFFGRVSTEAGVEGCIYRLSINGGAPEKVLCGMQGWFDISPDGKKLSYVRCPYQQDDYCSLYISDVSGANEGVLTTRSRPERITDNAFSPDARSIAFAAGQSNDASNSFGVHLIDVETRGETPAVKQSFANIKRLQWLPDGRSLLMTALLNTDETVYFWHVLPADGRAIPLKRDTASYNGVSLDRAGSLLVSTTVQNDFSIDLVPIDPARTAQKIGRGYSARYTGDGRAVFTSDRTGVTNVWLSDAAGGSVRQVTAEGSTYAPIGSSGGEHLFLASNRSGRYEVWQVNLDGSNMRQITRTEGGFPLIASPDGNWVYYISAATLRLRRVDITSGTEQDMLDRHHKGISVSPDTSQAAFIDQGESGPSLSIVSLGTSDERRTFPLGVKNARLTAWSPDGRSIYVLSQGEANYCILWEQKLDGSPLVRLREFSAGPLGERAEFHVAPDGQTFLLTSGKWKHNAVLLRGLN